MLIILFDCECEDIGSHHVVREGTKGLSLQRPVDDFEISIPQSLFGYIDHRFLIKLN